MTSINIPYMFTAPIQERRWVRNGLIPDATFQSGVCMAANQIARYRGKELFRSSGMCGFDTSGNDALVASAGSGARDRWRSYCHTGPFTARIAVDFVMCLMSTGDPAFNPYGRMRVLTAAGSTVGDAIYHFGLQTGTNTPEHWGFGTAYVDVSPDTDYQLLFSDVDNARMVSATAYEVMLDPDTSNGYIQSGYAATRNIYDTDRSDPMGIARDMWLKGGAHLLNWSVDDQASPITSSVTTDTNIVDTTSTNVSTSTPGFTLDLSMCDRLSETDGVTCVLAVYGKYVITPPVSGGKLKIKDSSGTTLATVTGFTSTAGWQTTTVTLPASSDKYDLHFASSSGTGTFSLHDVSLYQLGS